MTSLESVYNVTYCYFEQVDAYSCLPCYELADPPKVTLVPSVVELIDRQRVLTQNKKDNQKKRLAAIIHESFVL